MARTRILILFSMLFLTPAWAQQPGAMSEVEANADHAYTAKQWTEAESLYQRLTVEHPEKPNFWFRLGVAARADKHYDLALDALAKAKTLGASKGLPPFQADYEIASTYAAKGDATKALEVLKASADAGFFQDSRLAGDAEWSTLRADERFVALAKQVHHNAAPCEDPEFRQFDFWVGDWDVASPDGTPRGTSHISREMGGCVIWENWTSAGSPYFGKSYNTYNVNQKRWEQYWVDTSAGVMFFHGNLKDSVMDYWTEDIPQTSGPPLRRHLQFFNLGPNKVRQFSQRSTDQGKTWQVEYDFIYSRHDARVSATPGS